MSYRIALEPLKGESTKKPDRFAVCDIESKNWTEFLVIGRYDGKEFHYFYDMTEFIDYCFERPERMIYAHFGGIFDFMFVIQEVYEHTEYRVESIIPRGSGVLCLDVVRTVKKKKKQKNGKYKWVKVDEKITFKDSSALLPFSLKNITKSFGVDHVKQDLDVSNLQEVTEEVLEYLEYDCKGLYESLEKFYEWPLIKKAGPASTMASQSLKVLRTFLKEPIAPLRPKPDEFVRKSYFGGRTEVFKPLYEGKKPLYCYDVNSLYPTVMRDNDFPNRFIGWTYTYDPNVMGFYEAKVRVPKDMYIPPLPSMQKIGRSHKLVFPTGVFEGVWSTIELEYAKSLGVEVLSTGQGALFQNGGAIFKDYINTLYEMRLEAKERGDGVGDILTKLLMNSCYGRFGLSTEKEQLCFDDFGAGLALHSELTLNGRNVRLMKKMVDLDKTFTNVSIAAWVTSLSRIHMHKIFMTDPKKIWYTDTDSLFTLKKFKEGGKLGELKLEYQTTPDPKTGLHRAAFLLPKTYLIENVFQNKSGDWYNKVAMKGFDKRKIANFKFEDFKSALEGDLRHLKVTHDEKFAKFKTAVKKGSFLELMPAQTKQIRSMYDKRKVWRSGNKFDSKPLHIEGCITVLYGDAI